MFRWLINRLRSDDIEVRRIEARWREVNRATREAGCHCGKPATHVRRLGGNVGKVPVEVWSCEEHVNVNTWFRIIGDEHYSPSVDNDETFVWQGQVHPPRREL